MSGTSEGDSANQLLQPGQENLLLSRAGKSIFTNPSGFLQPMPRSALRDIRNDGEKQDGFKKPAASKTTGFPSSSSDVAIPGKGFTTPRFNETVPTSTIPMEISEPDLDQARAKEIVDVDAEDSENCQMMSSYVNSVYAYLRELEATSKIKPDFMANMAVRPSMRGILVDWLVEVHVKLKLLPETLYLNVAIMDQFLQVDKTIGRDELQLVGLSALLIASKYEEVYAPEVKDLRYLADNAYTVRELLKMEIRILKALNFSLGRPIPLQFLRRFTKVASKIMDTFDVLHHTLAKYLMELTLPEYSFCHHLPSELAAAALCLSLYILNTSETPLEMIWNDVMIHYSGYTVEAFQPLMQKLASLLLKANSSKLQAIRKKYASSKFYYVSTFSELKSSRVVSLAEHLIG